MLIISYLFQKKKLVFIYLRCLNTVCITKIKVSLFIPVNIIKCKNIMTRLYYVGGQKKGGGKKPQKFASGTELTTIRLLIMVFVCSTNCNELCRFFLYLKY